MRIMALQRINYNEWKKLSKSGFTHDVVGSVQHGNFFERYYHQTKLQAITRMLKQLHGNCIDIGCGTGFELRYLTAYFSTISAVDINESALCLARKYYVHEIKQKKLQFFLGDAYALPFKDSSFENTLMIGTIHRLDDTKALNEIDRVTKKNGHIFITFPTKSILWNKFIRNIFSSRTDYHKELPFNRYSYSQICKIIPKSWKIKHHAFANFGMTLLVLFQKKT